jgi:hypothetical protein
MDKNKFKQNTCFALGKDLSIQFVSNIQNDFEMIQCLNDGSKISIYVHYDYDKDVFMDVYTRFLPTISGAQEKLNLSTFDIITGQSAIAGILLFISEFLKGEMNKLKQGDE